VEPPGSPSRVFRILRRLGGRRSVGAPVAMVEELSGPSRKQTRIVVEQQRSAAEEAPAPGDELRP
jgi:hypothetical protein